MTTATKEILLPWRVESNPECSQVSGIRYHKIKDPKNRTVTSMKSRALAQFIVDRVNHHA